MRHAETDLFGQPIPGAHLVRKDGGRRKIGYAARPGTGPKGKRCALCANCESVLHKGSRSLKCRLVAHRWTHGAETDIHPNAPACREWQPKPFKATR